MNLIKSILTWLKTQHVIVIAAIIIAFGFVIGIIVAPQEAWAALTAIGTIGVVFYAVYREEYLAYRRRPILEINLFYPNPPHLIEIPEVNPQKKSSLQVIISPSILQIRASRLLKKLKS